MACGCSALSKDNNVFFWGDFMRKNKIGFFFFISIIANYAIFNLAHSSDDPIYYLGGNFLAHLVLDRDEDADEALQDGGFGAGVNGKIMFEKVALGATYSWARVGDDDLPESIDNDHTVTTFDIFYNVSNRTTEDKIEGVWLGAHVGQLEESIETTDVSIADDHQVYGGSLSYFNSQRDSGVGFRTAIRVLRAPDSVTASTFFQLKGGFGLTF